MKVSEAIRKGMEDKPNQITGMLVERGPNNNYCAWGVALHGLGLSDREIWRMDKEGEFKDSLFDNGTVFDWTCPCGEVQVDWSDVVIHLNDDHQFSFDHIATIVAHLEEGTFTPEDLTPSGQPGWEAQQEINRAMLETFLIDLAKTELGFIYKETTHETD